MMVDLSKIRPSSREPRVVDPIELFHRLKVADTGINDLWLAQGDALREWHANRSKSDVAVALNTGAGKTLVGLLIAQSIVNEGTRASVLYACSSIQLAEQTREKAEGYGLQATNYLRGRFDNSLFQESKAPCVTTYQALFNGKSIFFREDISAVVFDDAHAAEHLLRESYSLHVSASSLPELYRALRAVLGGCFEPIGKAVSFEELDDNLTSKVLLAPPSELRGCWREITRLLLNAELDKVVETQFAWQHLKDRLDACAVIAARGRITFTPPFLPVRTLSYFNRSVRRVYLSATLISRDGFARTFGCSPELVVAPKTTAGECERLILAPRLGTGLADDVQAAKDALRGRKALVLAPSHERGRKWEGFATTPPRESVSDAIREFRADCGTPKMLLVARFDGVDLPGDTCRAMVIDGLPTGVGPLERFLWESLGLTHGLRSTIASRVVQSLGRISRGMSDHGVVLLTSRELIDWLLVPRNRELLPLFLQKQLDLGFQVSRELSGTEGLAHLIDQFFGRDEEWTGTYHQFMNELSDAETPRSMDKLGQLAIAEATCAEHLWKMDTAAACKALSETLDVAFQESQTIGAWHALWLGWLSEQLGDAEAAAVLYSRAHGAAPNIPVVLRSVQAISPKASQQIRALAGRLNVVGTAIKPPPRLALDLSHLDENSTAGQIEESLRALGEYLGLESTRPEKETGTGPDVLWVGPNEVSLCMEVKCGKERSSEYRKGEIGQLSDHVQWVKDHNPTLEVVPAFVGPASKATDSANPPPDFRVIELAEFVNLSDRLVAMIGDICASSIPIELPAKIEALLDERGLRWPQVLREINCTILRGR